MKKITKIISVVTMSILPILAVASANIDKIESNTVYIKFDPKALGSYACVEQAKKDGTVVFPGVISSAEYKTKYSGFWLKDNTTCAYYKKTA